MIHENKTQIEEGNVITLQAKEYFDKIENEDKIVHSNVGDISNQIKTFIKSINKVNLSMKNIQSVINKSVGASNDIYSTLTHQQASLMDVTESATTLAELGDKLEEAVSRFKI